ncbi:unnamed protein product, partial [Rotaria socialis]
KDLICEVFIGMQQRIQQHNDNEKNKMPPSTLTRHTTNHSQTNDDQFTDGPSETTRQVKIMGTINDRNRPLIIELLDKKEYNVMLNSGKISIFGQLYDIDEFLPSPKLLICSKCNQPGHVKNDCKSASLTI